MSTAFLYGNDGGGTGATLTVNAPAGATVSVGMLTTHGAQLFDINDKKQFINCNVIADDIINIEFDNSGNTSTGTWANYYTNVSSLLKPSTTYTIITEVFECSGLLRISPVDIFEDGYKSQFANSIEINNPSVGVYVGKATTKDSFDGCATMCRGIATLDFDSVAKAKFRISVIDDTNITADTFTYRPFTGGKFVNYSKFKIAGADGLAVFKGLKSGQWTLTITDGEQTAQKTVEITTDYSTVMSFNQIPSFDYSGDCEIVNDEDEPITVSQDNWKIRFLTSGTLTFTALNGASDGIDVFLVGGGGGGSYAGGGGGYTKTATVNVASNTPYYIAIGSGGAGATENDRNGSQGGETTAFGLSASGGLAPTEKGSYGYYVGGNGGSGGGSAGVRFNEGYMGQGGSDGADGTGSASNYPKGGLGQISVPGPNGETGSTREFGEADATPYGAGGGGGLYSGIYVENGGEVGGGDGASTSGGVATSGAENTGGGGGGTRGAQKSGSGGSGIVIIRNAREVA